jgi:hypothetical protein
MAYFATTQLAASGNFHPQPRAVRFTVLGLRDPVLPLEAVNDFSFGLLDNLCPVPMTAAGRTNVSSVASSHDEVSANGYFLNIISGPLEQDPVRWKVEILNNIQDGNETKSGWHIIGASVARGAGAFATFFPDLPFAVPTHRDKRISIVCLPQWPWVIMEVVTYYVASIGWLLFILAGFRQHQRAAVWVLSGTYLVLAILEGAGAVGSELMGEWRQAIEGWMYCVPDALIGVCIRWGERHVLFALKAYGLLKVLEMVRWILLRNCFSNILYDHYMPSVNRRCRLQVIRKRILYHDSEDISAAIIFSAGFCAMIFTLFCVIFRYWAHYQARRLILADKFKYDEAWAAVLTHKQHRHRIASLKIRLQNLMCQIVPAQCRHYNRVRKSDALRRHSHAAYELHHSLARSVRKLMDSPPPSPATWEILLDTGLPGELDLSSPVDSLDQLYYQAMALNPILIKKIQRWAAVSGGCFQASGRAYSSNTDAPEPLSSKKTAQSVSAIPISDFGQSRLPKKNESDFFHDHDDSLESLRAEKSILAIQPLTPGYVRWNEVKEEEVVNGSIVKWGAIKSVQRSIEKSTRSYGKVSTNLRQQSTAQESHPVTV